MGGKSSAPASPDYQGAASATAAGNLANLQYQTAANRPNINTPWGSSTWTQGVDANGNPNNQWTNNVSLSPEQQSALDSQLQVQANQSNLAQTLQGQVANTMSTPYQAPDRNSYTSNLSSVNTNFSGFNPTGVSAVNQSTYDPKYATMGSQPLNQTFNGGPGVNTNFAGGPNQNLDASGAVASAGGVDRNAPQFSDANAAAGAKAAYEGATALLNDSWAQDATALDNKLRLQGLQPGTEAYNNAVQNQDRVVAQQKNALAQQSVAQGNAMANQNYASALAGYKAGNEAQNQGYSQAANTYALGNTAAATQYGQNAQSFQLGNAAQNQQFGQNAQTFGMTNDARTQDYNNALALYNAQLAGQAAGNNAQNQAYNQALAGYGANATAQQNSNAAQQQAYQQAIQNYGLDSQSSLQQYQMPLNNMNAVLSGQQVQTPSFPSFASAGYTPGTDVLGATAAQGSWNQGIYNQQQAQQGNMLGMLGNLGSAWLMSSDIRLKKNVFRIGNTAGGHAWYIWDWADNSGSASGVIAQEVAKTHPEAVYVNPNTGYLMVDYAAIH